MTTHWRLRPSTLRAIGVWIRLIVLTAGALVGAAIFLGFLAVALAGEGATWR